MEKVRTLQDLTKKCLFVCQTGGNNPKVKWSLEGLESVLFNSLIFGNHKYKLTPKWVINAYYKSYNCLIGCEQYNLMSIKNNDYEKELFNIIDEVQKWQRKKNHHIN